MYIDQDGSGNKKMRHHLCFKNWKQKFEANEEKVDDDDDQSVVSDSETPISKSFKRNDSGNEKSEKFEGFQADERKVDDVDDNSVVFMTEQLPATLSDSQTKILAKAFSKVSKYGKVGRKDVKKLLPKTWDANEW